jgi:hypothetical protein
MVENHGGGKNIDLKGADGHPAAQIIATEKGNQGLGSMF